MENINHIQNPDLTDWVFRDRNKDYGAYSLRRLYSSNMTKGIIIASLGFAFFLTFPSLAKKMGWFADKPKEEMVITQVELTEPPPLDENKPEPPPVEPPPPVKETVKFVPPVVKKDEEVKKQDEEVMKNIEEIKETNAQISTSNQEGDANANDNVEIITKEVIEEKKEVVQEKIVEEPKIFKSVEQMPEFPGGEAAMMKYLSTNIKYPKQAVDNNIEGKVFLNFVVNEDGDISNVIVKRGVDAALDQEAMRVVKSMPKWSPGKMQGKAVKVYYNLPVVFKLQ